MQTLDTTIVNVAMPYMQGSLAASPDQITWMLTSYIVAAAIMTPPVGWLAARFGRKNLFSSRSPASLAASMLCGTAESLAEIVLFRTVQGLFGASLVPLSQATILDIFPPAQRGQAMAIWVMGVVVGPILGPTLGGYLTDFYNWRWVFYINLPFGILAIAGLWLFLKDTGRNGRSPLRLRRIFGAQPRPRSVSAHARPRRIQGLVRLNGNHRLCRSVRPRLLSVPRPHVHRRAPSIPPRIFRDMNFVAGLIDGLRCRHADSGDRGACSHLICRRLPAVRSCKPACCWRRAAPAL